MTRHLLSLLLLSLCLSATGARAADVVDASVGEPVAATPAGSDPSRFFVRTGVASIMPSEGAVMKVGGAVVPGATISIDDHLTGLVEVGYRLNPNMSLAFTGGFPPDIDINGAGTAAPFGRVGGILYGPTALTLQYQVREWGWFQPYVGLGPMFMFVFDNKDGAMSGLDVDPAVGIAAQVGVDMMVNDRFGVFLDVKKARLRTSAKGSLGGAPVEADVKLDPLVLSGGITFRF
ncbi:OmpW family outer membrane protein [uncultured Aureimonas sp.]|uniref:OmpW/AlkL family protein n=1 Tax=uncultured Aureimonas sp. TaxID=1604662 RepID=UPI0025D55723|nr:OmpW family outer membrane protein [uncultured Aureimonas sp.]